MQTAMPENRIFQALADPSRRAILESLTRGEAAVKDYEYQTGNRGVLIVPAA